MTKEQKSRVNELMKQLVEGNDSALDELVKIMSMSLTKFVKHYIFDNESAREAINEIYYEIYNNLYKIDNFENCYAWIMRTAMNVIRNKRRVDGRVSYDRILEHVTKYDSETLTTKQPSLDMDYTLKALDQLKRDIVYQHCAQNLTLNELVIMFEIPFEKMKKLYAEGIKELKEEYFKSDKI